MLQIRDAQTSELIAETNDPTEVALIAEVIGAPEVLFDGVGPVFNARAVLQAYRENLNRLSGPEAQAARQAERNAARDSPGAREAMLTARARVGRHNRP